MPHCFWAEFEKSGKDVFRFDTRIYINPVSKIGDSYCCIGAVIGKNPGSAKSAAAGSGIQPIILDGDKLLPTVRSIVLKSYREAGIQPPQNGYIQVLNLFYLCSPDLGQALSALKKNHNAANCPAENLSFPWVWYVWGKASETLNPYKTRFSKLKSDNHFYYDKEKSEVIAEPASVSAFAKHTQGLKHAYIVPYLAGIIKK
jgi:hypothetical protein